MLRKSYTAMAILSQRLIASRLRATPRL